MANTWSSGEEFTSAKGNHVGTMWRRARRTNVSSGSTGSEVGVLRLDSIPVLGLHCYLIKAFFHPDTTVSTDTIRVQMRYRDDGGSAGTGNSLLPDATSFFKLGDAGYLEATYTAVIDQTLSVLLCVARTAGTGSATLYADSGSGGNRSTLIHVVALGVDPGNTGIPV